MSAVFITLTYFAVGISSVESNWLSKLSLHQNKSAKEPSYEAHLGRIIKENRIEKEEEEKLKYADSESE